jgi:2-desacetyl-2-hydroxyethyl bacteriochlorophyllide A dehydrogenase
VIVERLVFTAPHTCEVERVELDEAVGRSEVLVRNRVGLISPGTELAIFNRTHRGFEVEGHWARYPWWPGYASVGEVVAVGDRVSEVALGARVMHGATHATFARCDASSIIPLRSDLSDEHAAFLKLLGIALTPQLLAPLAFGERALVIGMGMVGNLAAQLCREAGAFTVSCADRSARRLEIARACGLVDLIDVAASPLVEQVGARAAYVIEAVGLGETVADALHVVAPDGRVVILSSPRTKVEIDPYFDVHHPGVHVIGAHEWRRDRAARRPYDAFLQHLLVSERVVVDPFVTHRVPFGPDLQRAYEGLRDAPDEWLGVVIEYPA